MHVPPKKISQKPSCEKKTGIRSLWIKLVQLQIGPLYYLQLKLVYEDLSLIHWNIHFFNLVYLSSQKVAKMYPELQPDALLRSIYIYMLTQLFGTKTAV